MNAKNAVKVDEAWTYDQGYPYLVREYTFRKGEKRYVGFVDNNPVCKSESLYDAHEYTRRIASEVKFLVDLYNSSLGAALYRINNSYGRGDIIPDSIRILKNNPDGSVVGTVTVKLQYGTASYNWKWSADRKRVTYRGKTRNIFYMPEHRKVSLSDL